MTPARALPSLLLLAFVPLAAWAGPSPAVVEPRVWEEFSRQADQTVIVLMRQDDRKTSPGALDATKDALLTRLAKAGTPVVVHRYGLLPMLALGVSHAQAAALAADPAVARVWADRYAKPLLDSSLPFMGVTGEDGWLEEMKVDGSGSSVAVLDSPIRYWNGYFGDCDAPGDRDCQVAVFENFTSQDIMEVAQNMSHGTNVGGIVAGVAPGTKLLSLNVFKYWPGYDDWLSASSDQIAALNWALEHKDDYGIVSANMSLGGDWGLGRPCNEDALFPVLETLYENGILVVIASGNEAMAHSLATPSCITLAVSAGAGFDTDLQMSPSMSCIDVEPPLGGITCFSNLNGALDVVAPGVAIDAGGLLGFGGTSMAAPHVAGAIALMNVQYLCDPGPCEPTPSREILNVLRLLTLPLPHDDGWVYNRLDLHRVPDRFSDLGPVLAFDEFYREEDEARLAPGGQPLALTAGTDDDGTLQSLYLHLEVIHALPEQVQVTLEGPDGTAVSFRLPGGQPNFNAVVGRQFYPGVFAPFAGKAVTGAWRLSLAEDAGGEEGYYISATLFAVAENCEPWCDERGFKCGDDGCGGSCGACEGGQWCSAGQQCLNPGEHCLGDTCASAVALPVATGRQTLTGTTLECGGFYEGGCGGSLASERVFFLRSDKDFRFEAQASGYDTVLYLRDTACDGEERMCNDDVEEGADVGSCIGGELPAGDYYLFMDGSYERGDYTLAVDFCLHDCGEKQCGDDGCGQSCGDCEEGRHCGGDQLCACDFTACGETCCREGRICTQNACACPFETCGEACCAEGEVCTRQGVCGKKPSGGCRSGAPLSALALLLLLAAGSRVRRHARER